MKTLEAFDAARKEESSKVYKDWGYKLKLNGNDYENYQTKEAFDEFILEMQSKYETHYKAFNKGGGSELKEGKRPPKMASAASSSRMMYLLARDIEGFKFEEKRKTGIRGAANLDGYYQTKNAEIYVEAKCREVFYTKYLSQSTIDAYKDVYRELGVEYKERGIFIVDGKELQLKHFDLKQMICHLLGIAKYQLNHKEVQHKEVRFLYLTHKLTETERDFLSKKHALGKVEDCMKAEQDEEKCVEKNIGWRNLYEKILKYQNKYKLSENKYKLSESEIDTMAKKFSFRMIDDQMFEEQIERNN